MANNLRITRALAGFILSGNRAKYVELIELLRKGGHDVATMARDAKAEAKRLTMV